MLPGVPSGGKGVPEERLGDLPGFLSGETGVRLRQGSDSCGGKTKGGGPLAEGRDVPEGTDGGLPVSRGGETRGGELREDRLGAGTRESRGPGTESL